MCFERFNFYFNWSSPQLVQRTYPEALDHPPLLELLDWAAFFFAASFAS
jgi:hypothetical protein